MNRNGTPTVSLALTLELSASTREKLARRAADAGKGMAELASDLIEKAVEWPQAAENSLAAKGSLDGWESFVGMMRDVAANLPPGHALDDSRERIYEDRGE